MHVKYGDETGASESLIYLQIAEDEKMGPHSGGNGYELLCNEADVVQSACQSIARAQGELLLRASPEVVAVVLPRAHELLQWRCRLKVRWLLEDETIPEAIALRASCAEDCYLRANSKKEPTTELIKKVAIAASSAFRDHY
jgi:hypothetical protein